MAAATGSKSAAAGGTGGGDGEIDISTLSAEQLQGLLKQVDGEISSLKQHYTALKSAEQRFRSSKEAVTDLLATPDREEVLVPMTGSLFVPGTIKSTSRVLVDVGTGFYVEKSPADAASILSKKEQNVIEATKELAGQIHEKEAGSEAISQMLYMKVQAAGGSPGTATS